MGTSRSMIRIGIDSNHGSFRKVQEAAEPDQVIYIPSRSA